MKNNLHKLLIGLLLLAAGYGYGQSEHAFAFVWNEKGKAALKEANAYKYEVAKKVYADLLRARGDLRQRAPRLVMNDGRRYVAWMDPVNVQIGLEEQAYDVCRSFGADSLNALAALLAHELTHYYEKHDWTRNFIHANEGLETARQIGSLDEGLKQETQADYLGGFLAFSAGYNVYGLMIPLLKNIYERYGLPEKIAGYPDLGERLRISENAMSELRELQTVYDVGYYLSLLECYEEADRYYDHILQKFQSRELYNNTGVNLSLAALPYFAATEMPYALPIEPDPVSRLHNLKGMQSDRLERREQLLGEALQQFEHALTLDPDYALGYLNKACALVLTGEWEDAGYWLGKGKKLGAAELESDFMVLEGIIALHRRDTTSALTLLAVAREKGSVLADLNLDILRQVPRPAIASTVVNNREIIDQLSLDDFLQSPSVDQEINLDENTICGSKQMPTSKVLVHYADDGRRYLAVQWCDQGCRDATGKDIRLGASQAEVTKAYGAPGRVIAQPTETILIYPTHRLLFSIDRQGAVKGWGTYRKSAK